MRKWRLTITSRAGKYDLPALLGVELRASFPNNKTSCVWPIAPGPSDSNTLNLLDSMILLVALYQLLHASNLTRENPLSRRGRPEGDPRWDVKQGEWVSWGYWVKGNLTKGASSSLIVRWGSDQPKSSFFNYGLTKLKELVPLNDHHGVHSSWSRRYALILSLEDLLACARMFSNPR